MFNRLKRISLIVVTFSIALVLMNCIYATDEIKTVTTSLSPEIEKNDMFSNVIDVLKTDEEYISSNSPLVRPFVNFLTKSAIYDTDISSFGVTFIDKDIEINGKMQGGQIVFATDKITVNGALNGAVLVSQNAVIINGNVTSTLFVIAPEVYINEGASVEGDVFLITPKAYINGTVLGSLIGGVDEELEIKGSILGDMGVTTNGNSINITAGAIAGNTCFKAFKNADELSAKYPYATVYDATKVEDKINTVDIMNLIQNGLIQVLLCTLIAYFIITKKQVWIDSQVDKIKQRPVYVMLTGFAGIVGIIIITLVTIALCSIKLEGLGILLVSAYITYLLASIILSMFTSGLVIYKLIERKMTFKKENIVLKKLSVLLLVYIAIFALCNIPYVATIFAVLFNMFTAGAIISILFFKTPNAKIEKI